MVGGGLNMIEYIVHTYDGNVIITLICTDICCCVKGGDANCYSDV